MGEEDKRVRSIEIKSYVDLLIEETEEGDLRLQQTDQHGEEDVIVVSKEHAFCPIPETEALGSSYPLGSP